MKIYKNMTINSIVMSYITTFTGKHFDPIHPVPEKIDMKNYFMYV